MTNRPEAASTGDGLLDPGGWVAGGWVAGGWVAGGWACCGGPGLDVHENPSTAVTPSSANSRVSERLVRTGFKSRILTSPILISAF